MAPNIEKPTTLGQRVEANNEWQNFNADAKFNPDAATNFNDLAAKIFPEDPQHPRNPDLQRAYQKSLVENLQRNLKDPDVAKFWNWLQGQGCSTVKIENGSLVFYSPKGEINIGEQCKPLQIEARSDYTAERDDTRERVARFTQAQLQKLRTEIEASRANA